MAAPLKCGVRELRCGGKAMLRGKGKGREVMGGVGRCGKDKEGVKEGREGQGEGRRASLSLRGEKWCLGEGEPRRGGTNAADPGPKNPHKRRRYKGEGEL